MKLKVKDMHVSSGGPPIVVLHQNDARKLGVYTSDRVMVKNGKKSLIAVADIIEKDGNLREGSIGFFSEVFYRLGNKKIKEVEVEMQPPPESISLIKKKLEGKKLTKKEITELIRDVSKNRFNQIELSFLVASLYMHELTVKEITHITEAIVENGKTINVKKKTLDKHCIGGVPGNRTTLLIVPIIAAAGHTIIKTSTRAITSAAGTSDTVETLAKVTFTKEEILKIVKKTNACMAWGGSMDLASADDVFIKIEHPLRLDPEGLMVASILSKKKAVGASYILIDIPVGPTAKMKDCKRARRLKSRLIKVGKNLKLKIKVVITDGSQPVGRGIGPGLEARDVLWILEGDPRAPEDLKKKSMYLSAEMLSMVKVKKSADVVQNLIDTGKAYRKFRDIIKAQGGSKNVHSSQIKLGKCTADFLSTKEGTIKELDNGKIAKAAILAGAPKNKRAGVYLYLKKGDYAKKGQKLLAVYADNKKELQNTIKFLKKNNPYTVV